METTAGDYSQTPVRIMHANNKMHANNNNNLMLMQSKCGSSVISGINSAYNTSRVFDVASCYLSVLGMLANQIIQKPNNILNSVDYFWSIQTILKFKFSTNAVGKYYKQ